MEALIWKSAACLRPSGYKFRKDNCALASPSCLVFGHSACFRRALSSRTRLAHSHSRCLVGGHFNGDGRISGPQRERTSRLARRANPEEIGLRCSSPSKVSSFFPSTNFRTRQEVAEYLFRPFPEILVEIIILEALFL